MCRPSSTAGISSTMLKKKRREVALVSFHSMLLRKRCEHACRPAACCFVVFGGLQRGVVHAAHHLRDGGHHAIFRIVAMARVRRRRDRARCRRRTGTRRASSSQVRLRFGVNQQEADGHSAPTSFPCAAICM